MLRKIIFIFIGHELSPKSGNKKISCTFLVRINILYRYYLSEICLYSLSCWELKYCAALVQKNSHCLKTIFYRGKAYFSSFIPVPFSCSMAQSQTLTE